MRRQWTVFLACLALSAGFDVRAAEPGFVGIWFSPNQPDEPGVMSLIEFKADGTFREEFHKCENGEVVGFQTQSGAWSLENGIEKTLTNRINGEETRVEDTYRVELLTSTQRRVRMEGMNLGFSSIRVEEFRFPDCAMGV